MKRLLYLVVLCFVASAPICVGQGTWLRAAVTSATPTWSFVTSSTSGTLTCSPACSAYGLGFTAASGDLLIVFGYINIDRHISGADAGYGTWVFPANCYSFASPPTGTVSCAYVLLTSSISSVTMTMNASGSTLFNVRQYHVSSGVITAETVPTGTSSASCGATGNTCNAPNVTLAGTHDVVISAAFMNTTGCSVAAPFGNFAAPSGDGIGDNLNTASGTGGSFKQGTSCPTGANSSSAMVSIAFQAN